MVTSSCSLKGLPGSLNRDAPLLSCQLAFRRLEFISPLKVFQAFLHPRSQNLTPGSKKEKFHQHTGHPVLTWSDLFLGCLPLWNIHFRENPPHSHRGIAFPRGPHQEPSVDSIPQYLLGYCNHPACRTWESVQVRLGQVHASSCAHFFLQSKEKLIPNHSCDVTALDFL